LRHKNSRLGKDFEAEIEGVLKSFSSNKEFWWTQFSDSYTARGTPMPAVLSDFLCCYKGRHTAIEAKESKEPSLHYKKRMKQLGRMYRYTLAGNEAYFIVKHKNKYYPLDSRVVYAYRKKHQRKSFPFVKECKSYKDLKKLLKEILSC